MIPSLQPDICGDTRAALLEGEKLFGQGRAVEAIECFQTVLAKDPVNVTALNNLGVIAFQLNDLMLAEQFLTKAVRLDRHDPESLGNLAGIYQQRGFADKARDLLCKAAAGGVLLPDLAARFPEIAPLLEIEKKPGSGILPPKKILVINNLFPPQELGGYGRIMADYTCLLRQRGHTVKVLASDTRSLGDPPAVEPHVQRRLRLFGEWTAKGMVEFPRDRILAIIQHNEPIIIQTLKQFKPDICLVGNIDLLSVLVFRPIFAQGIPVLHRLGNEFIGYQAPDAPRDPLYQVAVASQWLRDEAVRKGYPFQNAVVIHSGAFTREFQMSMPPTTDGLRIVFSGLVNGYKGPQVLIEALQMLKHKNIPFTCTLAGGHFDPQFTRALRERVEKSGLAENVFFSGLLDRMQLKKLFARHNILVFPSLVPETFGISQVEAMAAGLLVISSAGGGAEEVIVDGETGLRFKPGDAAALAGRLFALPLDREKWERIALCGRQRAMELFDIESSVDKLETAFKQMLQERENVRM